jgi:hypothetical protein
MTVCRPRLTRAKTTPEYASARREWHPLPPSAPQVILLVREMRAAIRVRDVPNLGAVFAPGSGDQRPEESRVRLQERGHLRQGGFLQATIQGPVW